MTLLQFPHTQPRLLPSQPSPAVLLRVAVDPAVAIGSLVACAFWFDGRFGGSHLILVLLVFAMTFPGNLARDTASAAALARGVAVEWLAMVTLLLLLGWASGTLANFDARAILAWGVATPLALFAAHRLVPMLLPWLLAAEGLQRTAVIVGANGLGRDLGAHLRERPLTGIRFAGYFDDRVTPRGGDPGVGTSLGNLGQLAQYVRAQHIDMIYITLPMTAQPRILALLEALHDTTASIYFAPDIFLCDLMQARVQTIGGLPVLAVRESPFYGMDGLVKRASDIVIASAILAWGLVSATWASWRSTCARSTST